MPHITHKAPYFIEESNEINQGMLSTLWFNLKMPNLFE